MASFHSLKCWLVVCFQKINTGHADNFRDSLNGQNNILVSEVVSRCSVINDLPSYSVKYVNHQVSACDFWQIQINGHIMGQIFFFFYPNLYLFDLSMCLPFHFFSLIDTLPAGGDISVLSVISPSTAAAAATSREQCCSSGLHSTTGTDWSSADTGNTHISPAHNTC